LKLAKRNEALAKQQLDLLKSQKAQAQVEPESIENSNKKSKKVKKTIEMSIEEIRAEQKIHNDRISSLEANEVQSLDFETLFQANTIFLKM